MKKDQWEYWEEKLRKPRKKRPRVKISGKSVLKLKRIIEQKRKK